MFRVLYSCIAEHHDIRLVALAACVCIFGCFTAINLLVQAREIAGRRHLILLSTAAGVFGTAVWTTHFIAELAFQPGLPVAYDADPTVLSLIIAICVAWLGMLVAVRFRSPVIGGFIIGAAVGAMHYVGMAAMRVSADASWNVGYVAASLTTGVAVAGAASYVAWLGSAWRYRLLATILLVVAICGLHFIAMAIALTPDPRIAMPDNVVAPGLLAVLVAAATIGIVILAMVASIVVEEQLGRRARHEAEELRRSQERLARVLRVSGIGCVERDLETGELEWSAEACRIFGVDPKGIPKTREFFYSLVHPEDRAEVHAATEQSLAGIASPPLEYRIVRPNGEVRVVYRENDVVLGAEGRPLRRFSVFKDITETHAAQERERELQRQLLHSQKLEALGTLAGGVAHDLNNTLVPIVALAKLALDELPADGVLRGDIETIVRASERARDLVKQILAFSRKRDLARQQLDLARATREALQMLRASVPATIQIVDQILDVPPVLGDPGELHQVIINLVTNAAQAIGSAVGRITVRLWAAAEGASHCEDNPTIFLSVADTGCGMSEAIVERIFEPFFTTKGVGDGTGLGLSVVHGIVTRHGGTITVRSELGEGSEVTVSLPVVGRPRTTEHVEPAAAA